MSQAKRDDQQFRRGVVLGLTFAEVLLLLIFLLMMVLASRLFGLHRELDREQTRREAAEHQLAALNPLFARLAKDSHFDITKEWVKLRDDLDHARTQLSANQPAIDLVERRRKNDPGKSPQAIAREIENEAALGRRFTADAHALSPKLPDQEARKALEQYANAGKLMLDKAGSSRKVLAEAARCHATLSTCKAQNANLSARLGGVLPPCWVDVGGKTQYIFDARLRETGIWLVDNHVPGREVDEKSLPISGFQFEKSTEPGPFVQAGQPLLAYSEKEGCRFYVRVYDETNAQSKERYKDLLRGVEGIFYKLLMK